MTTAAQKMPQALPFQSAGFKSLKNFNRKEKKNNPVRGFCEDVALENLNL